MNNHPLHYLKSSNAEPVFTFVGVRVWVTTTLLVIRLTWTWNPEHLQQSRWVWVPLLTSLPQQSVGSKEILF